MFKLVTISKTNSITNTFKPTSTPSSHFHSYTNKFKNNNSIKDVKSFQLFNNLQQKRQNSTDVTPYLTSTDVAVYLTTGILLGGILTYSAIFNNVNNIDHKTKSK